MKWFASLQVPWWIAGGWALDLYAGQQSRPHKDLDIGVLRQDIETVLLALPSWEIVEAKDGVLTPLRAGEPPRLEVNSLWCKPADQEFWALELMLDYAEDDHWVYRREPSIRRSLAAAILRDPGGAPFLAPEIQLLYKSRGLRPLDQADFHFMVPRLNAEALRWLKQALTRTAADHEWLKSPYLSGF